MMEHLHREYHGNSLKKREAKRKAKSFQCVKLYFEGQFKPKKIATMLKVNK